MEESKAKIEVPTGLLDKRMCASTHQNAQMKTWKYFL